MTEMEVAERKRSRGGFLNLFDWSGKSRKKLFSSNIQELSEESKQAKQNVENPLKSWQSLIEVDEIGKNSTFNPRSDSSCSASTVTSDEGQGSRAPSVVARLMGLESLPVPNSLEPRLIPDFDPFFLRSSRKASTWKAYENLGYVNLRNDYDGISWDHLESRTNKERNRPIERFQIETLPPRSAKPISVTHNKLLSPIRSPGFVQSRNPTYVMEEASRMIGPSPRLAARTRISSSGSSSSLPIRIRDLKEKLEASQKTPSSQFSNGGRNNKRATTSLKTPATSKFLGKSSSDSLEDKVKTSKPTSFTALGTSKLLGNSSSDGLKGKMKTSKSTSVSTPAHTKASTAHKRGSSKPPSGNRSSIGQKEKMETKSLKESSTSSGKSLLQQNNLKQNCRENQSVVTSVSNQKGNNKVVNKVLVESGSTSKKLGFTASVEKNTSLPRQKNLPRNKKQANGVQEHGIYSDKRIKRGEKLIKCNITVDAGLNKGEADKKKDVDVISFTFSSPIKGLSSDSQSSTKKIDQDTESTVTYNKISGDSLNILLEQKLRELTSKIESSCSSLTQEESSCFSSKDWMNGMLSLSSEHDKSTQNGLDKTFSESESVSDCTSLYKNRKFQIQTEEQEVNSISGLAMEQSSSDQELTWASSNEFEETELSESIVTSTFSEAEEGHNWELDYITEILTSDQLMVKEFSLGMATDILPSSLFNEMNSRGNTKAKTKRKTLFDYVNETLSFKCEQMFMGSCRGLLGKDGLLFERRELLAEEVKKEIQELKKMREMMMDELVDNDMSSYKGRWLDYAREAYEEGIDIEEEIVSALVDELVSELVGGISI